MKPKLQIIIMSYNRAQWLGDCIRSFLAQTYQDFELVVLDNASDQDIKGVLNKIDDPRVSLIINETNLGGMGNIREACHIAQGDYLMIFHDDDCAHPKLLEYQMRALDQEPDAVLALANCDIVREPERMCVYDDNPPFEITRFEEPYEIFREGLDKEGRAIGFGGTLYKTSVVKELLEKLDQILQRFSLCCDRVWLFTIAANGPVVFLETPMYQVRYHGAQGSQLLAQEYRYSLEYFKFQKELFGKAMTPEQLKEWDRIVAECFIMALVWHIKKKPKGLGGVLASILLQKMISPLKLFSIGAGIVMRRVLRKSI